MSAKNENRLFLKLFTIKNSLFSWCGHGDLNPNALLHRNLNPACLPVPSCPRIHFFLYFYTGKYSRWSVSPNPRFIKTGKPVFQQTLCVKFKQIQHGSVEVINGKREVVRGSVKQFLVISGVGCFRMPVPKEIASVCYLRNTIFLG